MRVLRLSNTMNAGGPSDKAKGKQRASEYDDATESGPSAPQLKPALKTLVIRFSEGISDLDLEVTESDAIRDIKRRVCTVFYAMALCTHRSVRFGNIDHNFATIGFG